jgi:hypothetical protein
MIAKNVIQPPARVLSILIKTPDDRNPLQSNANRQRGDSEQVEFALAD